MSSNKKIAITSAVLILLIIITAASIIAIFAAAQQTVNSEVSVTYKSEYVSGTASAKYYLGPNDKTGTPMRVNGEASGATSIEFNSRNSTQTQTLSPVEQEIKLSETDNFVVFEYYFTNTNSQNDYLATLTTSESTVKNMTVTTATSDSIIEDYSTIKDPVADISALSLGKLISANSNGFVYVRVEITNPDNDADFKINFNFDLAKDNSSQLQDELTEQTFQLEQNQTGYTVTGLQPDADTTNISIPNKYNGKPLAISADAFSDADLYGATITIDTKTVEEGTLSGQVYLAEIILGDNVETVEKFFDDDCSVGSLTIGKKVKEIFEYKMCDWYEGNSYYYVGILSVIIKSPYALKSTSALKEETNLQYDLWFLTSLEFAMDDVDDGDGNGYNEEFHEFYESLISTVTGGFNIPGWGWWSYMYFYNDEECYICNYNTTGNSQVFTYPRPHP